MQRIGVFVCHCGSNIAATIDVKKVVEMVSHEPGVVHAEDPVRGGELLRAGAVARRDGVQLDLRVLGGGGDQRGRRDAAAPRMPKRSGAVMGSPQRRDVVVPQSRGVSPQRPLIRYRARNDPDKDGSWTNSSMDRPTTTSTCPSIA